MQQSHLATADLLLSSTMEVLAYSLQKRPRNVRRRHIPVQDRIETLRRTVECIGIVFVLAHRNAIQVNTCKESAAPRPGEKLGPQRDVRSGLSVTPYWSSRRRRVAANLELVS